MDELMAEIQVPRDESSLIMVIGVGGAGCNAVSNMWHIDTFFASEKAGEKYADDFSKLQKYSDKTFIVSDILFMSFYFLMVS